MSRTTPLSSKASTPPKSPPAQSSQPESSSNTNTSPTRLNLQKQPDTLNIPVTAPDIISQATRGSSPNHDVPIQIYGGSVAAKYPPKNRTIITGNTPITLNDKQRLERMQQIVGELKDKLTIYKKDKSGLTEIISCLKQLSWLSMEISSHTKYTDDIVSQNISIDTWTILTTLARAFKDERVDASTWLNKNLENLLQTDIPFLTTAFSNISQIKQVKNKLTLSNLSSLTLPLTDKDYLEEAIRRLKITQTLGPINTNNKFFVLRTIEVIGETLIHLSQVQKNQIRLIEANIIEQMILLRDRIEHSEQGGTKCVALMKDLFEDKDNILSDIRDELIHFIGIFNTFLNPQPIPTSYTFTKLQNFVTQIPPAKPPTKTSSVKLEGFMSALKASNKIVRESILLTESKEANKNKLFKFLCKKEDSLTEDDFIELIKALGITGIDTKEIFKRRNLLDSTKFESLLDLLKPFPSEFTIYAIYEATYSSFDVKTKSDKKSLPEKNILKRLLEKLLPVNTRQSWEDNYELLQCWATKKTLDEDNAKTFLSTQIASNGQVTSNSMQSYLQNLYNQQLALGIILPITSNDQEVFNKVVNRHLLNIHNWFKSEAGTKPNDDVLKSINFLKRLSTNQELDIENQSDAFKLPGYTMYYLSKISSRDLTIDVMIIILVKNQIDLTDYQVTKPFFDEFRRIHKLPRLKESIEVLRIKIGEFRTFINTLSNLTEMKTEREIATLQCEYFLEGIARYAEALLDQPEVYSTAVGTTLLRTELQALKDFRNGVAHRPHATNPHNLSYMLNSTLLYMLSDLDTYLDNLQSHTFSFIPAPTPPNLSTIGELRLFIYDNRKTIIHTFIQAGAISRSWSLLGHAVGCDIGPQKFVTFAVEFSSPVTEIDLLLLEAEFRQKLGIHVMVVDQKDNERLYRNLHLSEKEISDLFEKKQDFSSYIRAELHASLYRKQEITLFDFGDGQSMRTAKSEDEASIAIRAHYQVKDKQDFGLELGNGTFYGKPYRAAAQELKNRGCTSEDPLYKELQAFLQNKKPSSPLPNSPISPIAFNLTDFDSFNLIDAVYLMHQEMEVSPQKNSKQDSNKNSMGDLYDKLYDIVIAIAGEKFESAHITRRFNRTLNVLKNQYPDLKYTYPHSNPTTLIKKLRNYRNKDYVFSLFVKELFELNKRTKNCIKIIAQWRNLSSSLEITQKIKNLYDGLIEELTIFVFLQPIFYLQLVTQLSQNPSINQDTFINDTAPHLYQQIYKIIEEKLSQDVMAKVEQLIQNEELYLFDTLVVTVPRYVDLE